MSESQFEEMFASLAIQSPHIYDKDPCLNLPTSRTVFTLSQAWANNVDPAICGVSSGYTL